MSTVKPEQLTVKVYPMEKWWQCGVHLPHGTGVVFVYEEGLHISGWYQCEAGCVGFWQDYLREDEDGDVDEAYDDIVGKPIGWYIQPALEFVKS